MLQVNELFRDEVVKVCKMGEKDVLWVHDYHLMLLPSLVSDIGQLGGTKDLLCRHIYFTHFTNTDKQL
jgi:trehalose-6-phosphate synthase